jgi:hypothetical protein
LMSVNKGAYQTGRGPSAVCGGSCLSNGSRGSIC